MLPETVVADDSDATSPWRLRAAALLTLGAVLVFAPLQFYSGLEYHVRALWPAYTVEAVLSVVLIAASYTATGRRHADRLSIVFIVGVTAQVLWGFAVSPFYPPSRRPAPAAASICGRIFATLAGIKLTHVPYKGTVRR